MKILVVDDDNVTRKLLGLYLKSKGYELTFAENGLDALTKLASGNINMVLTDLNMPYMDGLEFIRHMKREVAYRQIPVLMITTEADEEEKQKAFDAGADGYLIKPVSAEDVNCKVRELLKRIFKTGGDLRV